MATTITISGNGQTKTGFNKNYGTITATGATETVVVNAGPGTTRLVYLISDTPWYFSDTDAALLSDWIPVAGGQPWPYDFTANQETFYVKTSGGTSYVRAVRSNSELLTAGGSSISQISPGSGATDLGKAEDAVAGSGDIGIAMLVVRRDTASAAAADGDYVNPNVDANGNLRVTSSSYNTKIEITRPSDTTAYTAGDVFGSTSGSGIIQFTNIGQSGQTIRIMGTEFRVDLAAVPASMTSFRLHLYNASPTAIADNAVWDLVSADRASYCGYLDLGAPVDVGSTLFVQQDAFMKEVQLVAGTTLYGIIVTNGAYTPTSAATSAIRLKAEGI